MSSLPPELVPQPVEPSRANALAQARALLNEASNPAADCAIFIATVDADNWVSLSGCGNAEAMLRVATAMLSAIQSAAPQHGDADLAARCAHATALLGMVGRVEHGGARLIQEPGQ